MKLVDSVRCRVAASITWTSARRPVPRCELRVCGVLVKVDVSTHTFMGALALEAGDAAGCAVGSRRKPVLRRGHDGERRIVIDPYAFSRWNSFPPEKARTGYREPRRKTICTWSNRSEGSVS